MANKETNLYAASILAERPFREGEEKTGPSHYEHFPALIASESFEDAAEELRACTFERWPIHDGWHGHQVNLITVKVQAGEGRTISLFQ